jgi:preprotein translocase subunit SecE
MALKIVNQSNTTKRDWLKWLLVGILIIAGLGVNYYYSHQPWPLRLLGGLFLVAVVLGIISQTFQGRQALIFARESRMELRKVTWPTRPEVMQTTLVVAVMVIVLALLLWGIDGILMWLIGWLTGQRG